jgi:hypothetical protein
MSNMVFEGEIMVEKGYFDSLTNRCLDFFRDVNRSIDYLYCNLYYLHICKLYERISLKDVNVE